MRISVTLTTVLVVLSLSVATSQNVTGICGTEANATVDRLLKNREAVENGLIQTRGAVTYVPVKYHLVARTNMSGRVSETNVALMHCHLNEIYADQDIQFYIKDGFSYINNTAVYDDHVGTQGSFMTILKDRNALNVYIVNDATPSGGGGGGQTLGYYSHQHDWIVMRIDQVNGTSQTLAHEAGHFFSLMHPFNGWEGEPFESSDAGWPVAPAMSPGAIPTEKMDGSNCMTSGDFVCDTRPDYNFGLIWQSTCDYTGGAKDPSGVTVDPDETLIMSYFKDVCVNRFTDDQKDLVAADLVSSERNYIRSGYVPTYTSLNSGAISPVFPANEEVVTFSPDMTIDWIDLPGATMYVFEISAFSVFPSVSTDAYFVTTSSVNVSGLTNNKTYYWRVRPMNEYVTCESPSDVFRFSTSTTISANEIPFVKSFALSPNPASKGNDVRVTLNSEESFSGKLRVFNLAGQEVFSQSREFNSGENSFFLGTGDLSEGVYLLRVDAESGSLLTKFVISQ